MATELTNESSASESSASESSGYRRVATLVATDLDGTVWDHDMLCHRATRAAIDELVAHDDVVLMAATGRRRTSARRGFERNGLLLPSVLLNGALGFDFEADTLFHQVTFALNDLQQTLDVLGRYGLSPVAHLASSQAVAVEGVTTCLGHLDGLGQDLQWSSVSELAARDDVLGMSMLGIEIDAVEPALGALGELAGVEVAAYADRLFPPFSLMLAPANVTKEVGIRAYLAYAKIAPDRIIALGDGGNDLEMLAMADVALAVTGGDQRAIDQADHVIERPENGGWAAVLDYL